MKKSKQMKTLKYKGGMQHFAGIALGTGSRGFMGDAVVSWSSEGVSILLQGHPHMDSQGPRLG